MRSLLLLLALAGTPEVPKKGLASPDAPKKGLALPAPAPPPAAPAPASVVLTPQKKPHEATGTTPCAACHATSSWTDVRFNHERTGYPLTGKHQRASCKACHASDFNAPVPTTCLGCHRDVHDSELGTRCEGCHETTDWRSRFDADAHRRTNFPLIGAHAALPCIECHAETRERRFSRAVVDCLGCHQADLARTTGLAVDHQALGFAQRTCRECHGAVAFKPARFPTHDDCFVISRGHAGQPCGACHTTLKVMVMGCRTGTATLCKNCHTNTGGGGIVTATDAQHSATSGYPGYSVSIGKCIDCHLTPGHL